MSTSLPEIHIDVVSDVSCPWCYVGRRRLINAITQLSTTKKITYTYHPFIIDTGTQKDGEEYMAYNVRRWGGDGWVYSMKRDSLNDGCTFKAWKYWPYSLHCHRLMWYANTVGKGGELMGIFFEMNYEEGKNLSVKKGLMEAAERCGLDLKEAENIIDDQSVNKREVLNEYHKWSEDGVGGVPFFIVHLPSGKEVQLEGAVSTSKWLKVLGK
ncbi:hypothetical protein EIN_510940 [Entamoeba invadens IP1]|uniref:DSBA-like thioredoxin domain-containing protein n=1 Tax=Entamoeba invadens IP1 TaxID=370355 RepID=A0A0A1TX06_ENTIV|nr:hypothetical protein EIN_510940 [Entamoeba invadens IP1]ELP83875.1 hypothetical protein EIN_510940 [Entamoeba invadens IP1]|eukprot:XP_004183221.1 hypothetical protein EIN_510940 [Entamoeba invadens IP1]